jgi:cell division protein ZipA
MSELRWALLLAGVVLVAGVVLWDVLRKRSAVRPAAPGEARQVDPAPAPDDIDDFTAAAGERAEPTFSGPDLPARDPVREPRLMEIVDPSVLDSAFDGLPSTGPIDREAFDADAVGRAEAWVSADATTAHDPGRMVLDWPPEDTRRIVTLRVAPRPGEKFTGAALRQALSGEGFRHGDLDIFHKPLGDGRVFMSAASLTRPGTFQLATMDTQLFGGLSLFAVLPGPLPPRDAIDRLCLVARTLAQRLRGHAHDERGQPLTDARIAELRREAASAAPAPAAAAGAGSTAVEPPQNSTET